MSHKVKAKLVKLSCCGCGFLALREGIPLGKIYTVYPELVRMMYWGCGGCGKVQWVPAVVTDQKGGPPMPLPVELFEFETEPTTETLC